MGAENVDDPRPGQAGPSEQDAQALVERLRVAPAAEILTEVLSTLLSTAQVKLGRRDARLFIDLSAVLLEHAKGVVPDGLRGQVDAALGELRMGQVAAERELADADAPEQGDLPRTPAPPQAEGPTTPGSVEPPGSRSGLWVPGR
jgi:hypothetical protein